jgi:hypothetical protein
MKKHYRTEHGWVNPHARGRVSPKVAASSVGKEWEERPWRTGVWCQQLFQRREASCFFEVDRQRGDEPQAGVRGGGDATGVSWRDVVERHEAVLKAEREEARRTADGRTGVDFESTWIRKIGSAKHLANKDLPKLWGASAEPMTQAAQAKLRDEVVRLEQRRMTRLVDDTVRNILPRRSHPYHLDIFWSCVGQSEQLGLPQRRQGCC